MGSICITKKHNELEVKQVAPTNKHEEIETILYQEFKEIEIDIADNQTCLIQIKEIEEISIHYMLAEMNNQKQFLKLQILKPLQDLQSQQLDYSEILCFLQKFHFFLEQVQDHRPKKLCAWWDHSKPIVDIEQAISYWNSQIISFGGKLRREIALRGLEVNPPPTSERFVKTREWIRKQTESEKVEDEGIKAQQIK